MSTKIYRKEIFSKTFIKQHEIDTGSITEFDNFALPLYESKNFIEQKKKNDKPFLKLKSTHINEGNSILKKMGIKKNEKFVTLHIRQFGWRGETKQNTNENFRTPSVSNYIDTIKYLTQKKIRLKMRGEPQRLLTLALFMEFLLMGLQDNLKSKILKPKI